MNFVLELAVLYVFQTFGNALFAKFEVETPAWKKIFKWNLMAVITFGVYYWEGHIALLVPFAFLVLGATVHFYWCRKNGIHPLYATPRKRYYELRGWNWIE